MASKDETEQAVTDKAEAKRGAKPKQGAKPRKAKRNANPRKAKPKIYMFDPVIYPLKLWVAVEPNPQDIIGKFYGILDGSYDEVTAFTEKDFEKDGYTDATTYQVRRDGKAGALVIIWRPKCFGINGISHEASHVTDLMCEYLGVSGFTFNDGEARAYFNGWVAECLDKAKRGKV